MAVAFHETVHALNKAGHEIKIVSFAELLDLTNALRLTISAEARHFYKDYLERLETEGDPHVLFRLHQSNDVTEEDLALYKSQRAEGISLFKERLAPFDALLSPTIMCERPAIADALRDFSAVNAPMLRNTTYINLVDGCAMSIPVPRPDLPPSALMVCGANGSDAAVIAASRIIDRDLKATESETH